MAQENDEQLAITVIAKLTDLEKQMAKASGITARAYREMSLGSKRATRQMEQDAIRSANRINQAFASVNGRLGNYAKAFGAGLVAKVSIQGAQQLVDSATRIQNALKVAGLEGAELAKVYDRVYAAAQKNAAPLEALVTLYGRASLVQKDLKASTEEMLNFTDKVALALRVSGSSAEESSGALLQLSQLLGAGTVRAEEFNSVQEGALPILQAVAAGMKEAGGSVSKLRSLVIEGKVSSEAFFRAFEAGAPVLEEKIKGAETTISGRLIRLQNVLIDAAGRFDKSAEAAKSFGGVIDGVSNYVSTVNFDNLIRQLSGIIQAFQSAEKAGTDFFAGIGRATGLDNIGSYLAGPTGERSFLGGAIGIKATNSPERQALDMAQKRLEIEQKIKELQNSKLAHSPLVKRDIALYQAQLLQYPEQSKPDFVPPRRPVTPTPAAKVEPISIEDYTVPASDKKKKAGSKAVSKSADQKIDDDIQSVKDRTAALVAETAAVGLSYQEGEKRKISLELEQAALAKLRDEAIKKGETDLSGIQISEDQRQKIDAISEAYANQAEELRKVQEQHEKVEQASNEFYEATKGGLIGAITGANSLGEALDGILMKLEEMLLNSAFDALFQPASGSSSGGTFGNIFSSIGNFLTGYASGTNFAPGGLAVVGEKGPEIVDLPRGSKVIPNHAISSSGRAGSQRPTKADFTINVNGATGNTEIREMVQKGVSAGLEVYDRSQLPDSIAKYNNDPNARG